MCGVVVASIGPGSALANLACCGLQRHRRRLEHPYAQRWRTPPVRAVVYALFACSLIVALTI